MNYQKFIAIGNATDQAKVHTPEGKKRYVDFTIAVNRSKDEADFFPVSVFDPLAETALKIKNAQAVFVEGRLNIRSYKAKDGIVRKSGRIVASWLILL